MKIQLEGNIAKTREEYQQAHAETVKAQEKESALLSVLRENCNHSLVAEVPYEPGSEVKSYQLAFRICEICGLDEEGAFYKVLTAKRARIVSRETGYALINQPLEDIEY